MSDIVIMQLFCLFMVLNFAGTLLYYVGIGSLKSAFVRTQTPQAHRGQ